MKKFLSVLVGTAFMLNITTALWAGEVDILLDVLVRKGILTAKEAAEIKTETETYVTEEVKQGNSYAVPKWVQSIKLKGDLRTRYQYDKREAATQPRHRARIRARVGTIAQINNNMEVGVGIATGAADPRSTNQTLEDTFSHKSINLDYAYFKWLVAQVKGLTVVGGKFERKDFLWVPTDMLWDSDINPEGASVAYTRPLIENKIDMFLSGGIWVLDERNAPPVTEDPILKYLQGGFGIKEGKVDAKVAATWYMPRYIRNLTLENDSNTNTGAASTGLESSYRSIAFGTEVGVSEPFGGLPFGIDQRIAVFGEYIQNYADHFIDDELSGQSFGFLFGHKKVGGPGTWQFKYIKAKLERDAWIDAFPDSDRFGGSTGIESHEGILEVGLTKNVSFGLDYYKSWLITVPQNKERLLQADINFKF